MDTEINFKICSASKVKYLNTCEFKEDTKGNFPAHTILVVWEVSKGKFLVRLYD